MKSRLFKSAVGTLTTAVVAVALSVGVAGGPAVAAPQTVDSNSSASQLVPWIWPSAQQGAKKTDVQLVPWIWPSATRQSEVRNADLVPWIWPNSKKTTDTKTTQLVPWIWPNASKVSINLGA
mgnify:CR=1 FL=1